MRRALSLSSKRTILVALFTGLVIASCGDSSDEARQLADLVEPCSLNSDCRDPYVCTFARCHQECNRDRDCDNGEERCVVGEDGNVCQLAVETKCDDIGERDGCQGDQICGVDGECRDECEKDEDCLGDQVCAKSGECASKLEDKDTLDDDGNILPDMHGEGGAPPANGGSGGRGGATGGRGGAGGAGGAPGGAGEPAIGEAGSGGEAGGGAVPDECPEGFRDCDDDPSDCETSITLITSCGACDRECDASHGGDVQCDPETLLCTIDPDQCMANFADCDDEATNGCEAELPTDAENCGECGRSCGGGTCVSGQCSGAVAVNPGSVTSASYLYGKIIGDTLVAYTTYPWTIRTVPLPIEDAPVDAEPVYAPTGATAFEPTSIAFDSTNMYFASTVTPSTVYRRSLDGEGAIAEVFRSATGSRVWAMTLSATAFYYAAYPGYGFYSRAKSGSAEPSAIPGLDARSQVYQIIATPKRLFWIEAAGIHSAPLGGGTPELHDDLIQSPAYTQLVSDGDYVYWNRYRQDGAIARIDVDAEGEVELSAAGQSNPVYPVVDDEYVYFIVNTYQINRAPKAGGEDAVLVATLNRPPYFSKLFGVDDTYVYGVGSGGEILRLAKSVSE